MGTELYIWLIGACVIFSLFASLLCIVALYYENKQPTQPPSDMSHKEKLLLQGLKWWGNSKQKNNTTISGVVRAMRQAGYISSREQILCVFKLLVIWGCIGLISFGQLVLIEPTMKMKLMYGLLMVLVGVWITIRWFTMQGDRRAKKMDDEMLVGVHLMAILWKVGLSIESLLKAYYEESGDLTPEINKEIDLILARIDVGQSRESVFSEVASISLSSSFQDLLIMLSQVGETGGGLSQSFQSLAGLLEQKKRTDLQEKVTKMSGKISAIMMVFMFPALFIVLGGPAALALMTAFGG